VICYNNYKELFKEMFLLEIRKNPDKNISNTDYNMVLIPNDVLEIIRTKLGDEVLLVYDNDTNELSLIKKPESFTKALRGLGKEMWKSVDGENYINQERTSWE
jgi:hypothetical protein